jgi:hypothetical protein
MTKRGPDFGERRKKVVRIKFLGLKWLQSSGRRVDDSLDKMFGKTLRPKRYDPLKSP